MLVGRRWAFRVRAGAAMSNSRCRGTYRCFGWEGRLGMYRVAGAKHYDTYASDEGYQVTIESPYSLIYADRDFSIAMAIERLLEGQTGFAILAYSAVSYPDDVKIELGENALSLILGRIREVFKFLNWKIEIVMRPGD
jgi:hypothetical protein